MDQSKKKVANNDHNGQFQYLGRWVDTANFRAHVYDNSGNQKLANSHKEFMSLMESGLWFASKPEKEVAPAERKQKNVTLSNSK